MTSFQDKADHVKSVEIRLVRLSPAEAELLVLFTFQEPLEMVELRGRLTGPACPYSTTVEIAYPFRPHPRQKEYPLDIVAGRIIIPEPSFWDPVAPFLYEGQLELWQGDAPIVQMQMSYGFRTFQLGQDGLKWNGKPLRIQAIDIDALTSEQARQLHTAGYNTLVVDANEKVADLCHVADRFGFLVLVRPSAGTDIERTMEMLKHCTSCLGWILPEEWFLDLEMVKQIHKNRQLAGLSLQLPTTESTIGDADFLLCEKKQLSQYETVPCPKLVWTNASENAAPASLLQTRNGDEPAALPDDVFGVVVF